MNRVITFYAAGSPQPQPRTKAAVRGQHARVYTPTTADKWKAKVRQAWADSGEEPFHGAVRMRLVFVMARPAGHWTSKQALTKSAPPEHISRPDIDNLAKAVMDALGDVKAYPNDAAVIELHAGKRYAAHCEVEGCRITLIQRDA